MQEERRALAGPGAAAGPGRRRSSSRPGDGAIPRARTAARRWPRARGSRGPRWRSLSSRDRRAGSRESGTAGGPARRRAFAPWAIVLAHPRPALRQPPISSGNQGTELSYRLRCSQSREKWRNSSLGRRQQCEIQVLINNHSSYSRGLIVGVPQDDLRHSAVSYHVLGRDDPSAFVAERSPGSTGVQAGDPEDCTKDATGHTSRDFTLRHRGYRVSADTDHKCQQ